MKKNHYPKAWDDTFLWCHKEAFSHTGSSKCRHYFSTRSWKCNCGHYTALYGLPFKGEVTQSSGRGGNTSVDFLVTPAANESKS